MKNILNVTLSFVFTIILVLFPSCSDNPADEELVVGIGGNLFNSKFEGTIIKADLLFDGNVIASASFSNPGANAQLIGTVNSAKKGSHTISFRITTQTSSPNTYETLGPNVKSGSSSTMLGDLKKSLATGESISYTVDL